MPIPSYSSWMTRTKRGVTKPRSSELKALDKALETFDKAKTEPNKAALKNALAAWIADKGPGDAWKRSTRNTDKVVEELYAGLYPPGAPPPPPPKPYRVAPAGWKAAALPVAPTPGSIHLAQSFEYANSSQRNDVPRAFERAKEIIFSAYLGIKQVRPGGTNLETRIYTTFFGTYDAARLKKVTEIVNAIHGALWQKPVVLYYRGDGVLGANDCPAESGDMTPGSYFGAAWPPGVLPASLDRKYTYIFLGKAFFTSGVHSWDSIPGVIIHELSHSICSTDDVVHKGKTTYGIPLCTQLAIDRPDLAINNADSYEYLCECYQAKSFTPKENTLVLPPKASINLQMRAPT